MTNKLYDQQTFNNGNKMKPGRTLVSLVSSFPTRISEHPIYKRPLLASIR
jgi:hypothetical protein